MSDKFDEKFSAVHKRTFKWYKLKLLIAIVSILMMMDSIRWFTCYFFNRERAKAFKSIHVMIVAKKELENPTPFSFTHF